MERRTRGNPKQTWSEKEREIEEKLEEERRIQERLNQQIREEEEIIRVEREQHIRPRRLTEPQRKLRKIIQQRASDCKRREARAATDENFRQQQEAKRERGGENRYQRWRSRPFQLSAEEKSIRIRLSNRARERERRHGRPATSAVAENSNQETEIAGDEQNHQASLSELGDLPVDGFPGKMDISFILNEQ